MARIVLTTIGTLGDLHPYLALGIELASRGHRPVVATHPSYRERVERAGIEFRPVRPDFTEFGDLADVMRRAMDPRQGSEYVVKHMVLPTVRATYDDLLAACDGAEVLVGHMLTFAAPIVAQKLGLPRVHTLLQPFTMFSAYDPPQPPLLEGTPWAMDLGPTVWKVLWLLGRIVSRPWFRIVDDVRISAGLPHAREHPMFDGYSPTLNLALFSSVLASRRPDWPPNTVVTGFPIYDRDEGGRGMPAALRQFLDAGPDPVVFTLGSSGVWDAGEFYREAASAAHALDVRAVLLTGPEGRNVPTQLPAGVLAVDYAPHSELFAHASVVVHQGGIGTTGQALRSGRPMLIVPFSHDQPDNARRCARLGVARVLRRGAAGSREMVRELGAILRDPALRERAAHIGVQVSAERGAHAAADAIEAVLDRIKRSSTEPVMIDERD